MYVFVFIKNNVNYKNLLDNIFDLFLLELYYLQQL